MRLFHLIIRSICSAGIPVLISLDDCHWCDPALIKGVVDVIVESSIWDDTCQGGLLLLGTYRANDASDQLVHQINVLEKSNKTHLTKVCISDLTRGDVANMLSAKLCLPTRYTRELASLVYSKTARGNPFFVIQFLRTVTQNKMLEYSVKHRRWKWDIDTIEMQMISDETAALLTTRFRQLPRRLMQTLTIISCLGSQVEEYTLELLNSEQQVLSFNMLDQLQHAVNEGLLEKAGPMYMFTHDLIMQYVYEQIPISSRKPLHKTIVENLVESMKKDALAANDAATTLLVADQINKFGNDGNLGEEERSQYVHICTAAARIALSSFSFDQGMSFLCFSAPCIPA